MAATVLTRSTWTDDNGTGTTGTIINNAVLHSDIYDKVDQLFAGAGSYSTFTFGGSVAVDGAALIANTALTIRRNTSDGGDSSLIQLTGGGATGNTRGGGINVYGNEHASTGKVEVVPGNVTGSKFSVVCAGAEAFYVDGQSGQVTAVGHLFGKSSYRASLILDVDVSATSVVNTTTPTSVYSFSVPANILASTFGLRLTGTFNVENTTGSSQTLTVTVTFGGSTVVTGDIQFTTSGTTPDRRFGTFTLTLRNFNATNAQRAGFVWAHALTAGDSNGSFFNGGNFVWAGGHRALTVDTTSNQALAVGITLGAASAVFGIQLEEAVLELI